MKLGHSHRIEEDGVRWSWDLSVKADGDAFVGLLVHKGEQKAARKCSSRGTGVAVIDILWNMLKKIIIVNQA